MHAESKNQHTFSTYSEKEVLARLRLYWFAFFALLRDMFRQPPLNLRINQKGHKYLTYLRVNIIPVGKDPTRELYADSI